MNSPISIIVDDGSNSATGSTGSIGSNGHGSNANVYGSNAYGTSNHGTLTNSGAVITGSIGAVSAWSGPVANSLTYPVTLNIPSQPVSEVQYVIVDRAGNCKEMNVSKAITPREMIGICKFISIATISRLDHVSVDWTSLVQELKIEGHFVNGLNNYHSYSQPGTHFVFLHDPKFP